MAYAHVEAVRSARELLVDIDVDEQALLRACTERFPSVETPPTTAQVVELALADACIRGDRGAIHRFERDYLVRIPGYVASLGVDSHTAEDVTATVRAKLLVGSHNCTPKLVTYAGRGNLHGLIRVASIRAAIDILRTQRSVLGHEDSLLNLPDQIDGLELRYLRTDYQQHFSNALMTATRRLTARQRSLLRLHALDGVDLEALATAYRVHRSTIVRWIASAKAQLVGETQSELVRMGVARDVLPGTHWLPSQLDISLRELFASQRSRES